MAGVHSPNPLPTYPNGFPDEIMIPFSEKTGRKWLANKPASGTDILDELGEEHMKTGALIVYTSADSVFQIAAHEEVVPIDELYRYCQIARETFWQENMVLLVLLHDLLLESQEHLNVRLIDVIFLITSRCYGSRSSKKKPDYPWSL